MSSVWDTHDGGRRVEPAWRRLIGFDEIHVTSKVLCEVGPARC